MRKKIWERDAILLLVTTLVTVTVWVGTEVYRAYVNTRVPTGVEKLLRPLDPVLNVAILDKIEERNP